MPEDWPNKLSSVLGELVKKLSDAYFSGTGKQINVFFRFFVATTGAVFYMIAIFIFAFNKWSDSWDTDTSNIILQNSLLILTCIVGFGAYLGLLVSLTKSHHSYTRLFLAGAFLPAIVFALVFLVASRLN